VQAENMEGLLHDVLMKMNAAGYNTVVFAKMNF
jgi:hypothetical protein